MTDCRMAASVPTPYVGMGGKTRYRANCITCDVLCSGWTPAEALAEFEAHRDIPAPPAEVLAAPFTREIWEAYPDYYHRGRGRPIADSSFCPHGTRFTDSPCVMCDAEDEQAETRALLQERHDEFLHGIGERLDLDAGLQEVMRKARGEQ